MSADVNSTMLREPDPIAAAEYEDGGGKVVPIPPKGSYTLRTIKAETRDGDGKLTATKDGYFQATLTDVVVAPGQPYDGHEIRYHRVNTKTWPNRKGSSMGDYLRAHGMPTLPSTNEAYEAAVQAVVNRPYEASIDWSIFNSAKGLNLKGEENFPLLPDGKRQDWVPDPTEPGKKVYARAEVRFTVSKVGK